MDEPLSNLDAQLRIQMRLEIKRLQQDLGATTLYVTHDQVEAMTMADRIAVLRDGLLQQLAPPLELYSRPANTFVARFVGSPPMNMLTGERQRGRLPAARRATSGCRRRSQRATSRLGFRPEAATMTEPGRTAGQLQLPVYAVEPLGNEMIVAFRSSDDLLNVRGARGRAGRGGAATAASGSPSRGTCIVRQPKAGGSGCSQLAPQRKDPPASTSRRAR